MQTRSPYALCAAIVCGVGCVQVERPGSAPQDAAGPALHASDWNGVAADTDDLPRRPRLTLVNGAGFAPIADAILLLRGRTDAELRKDLERAPLLAAHRAHVIDMMQRLSPGGAMLAPQVALEPDADYTLALAGWAQDARGERIDEDAAPILYPLHTTAEADGGARVAASWPADGATGVGTNLDAVVVAFDGTVQDGEHGVWLQGPDDLAVAAHVAAGECAAIAPEQAHAFCVRVEPAQRLAPSAAYALIVGAAALDAHGAPVGPWRARFRTASGGDPNPPQLAAPVCAIDEQSIALGCALIDDASISLHVQADEAVSLQLRAGDAQTTALAPSGDAWLRLHGFAPDTKIALDLTLSDSSGNRAQFQAEVRTLAPLATLTIAELRADPLGPEPQQEFVELWNYGTRAIDLAGFTLADKPDAAGQALPAARIEPHARALLVADAFDASEPRDVAPPPGAALIRTGKSLASSGLSNSGEPLFLRDALGRRVSAAPASPRPRSGVCNVRVGDDMRDGSEGSFDYAASAGCTPGR